MPKRESNIYHRKDGRWEGRFHIDGTKKYISVYGKSYQEAREKLHKLKEEQVFSRKKCAKYMNDLIDEWFMSIQKKVKTGTLQAYSTKLNNHILPFFKGKKYEDMDCNIIEQFGQSKINEGLSPKYVSDMVIIVKSVAKWANRVHNYANNISDAELPKSKRKEPELLSDAEQSILKEQLIVENSNTSVGILLTLFTGLRIGEICALQWSDIDFEHDILYVRKSLQRISLPDKSLKSKSVVSISTPKTESSVREIPLPKSLVNILKEKRGNNNCFVLSGNRKPVESRCLSYRFKAILKKANLPSVKFHSLRHMFATNCLQKNFDIKTLSEILGHADVSTTMRVYVHSSMERKRVCMNLLSVAH